MPTKGCGFSMFLELPSLQMRASAQVTVRVYSKGTWRPGYKTVSRDQGCDGLPRPKLRPPLGQAPGGLPQGWSKPQCPFANINHDHDFNKAYLNLRYKGASHAPFLVRETRPTKRNYLFERR